MDEWVVWPEIDGIEESKGCYRTDGREDAGGMRPGYQDLIAWQKAMDLVLAVYRESQSWPAEERYGLTSQIRRAAVAIPSNLAEGHGRSGPREFAHHASIAYGSLCEVETQLLIAGGLGYLDSSSAHQLHGSANDVRRVTLGLLRSLTGRAKSGPPS